MSLNKIHKKISLTQYANFISDTCKQISKGLFESISNMQVNSKVRTSNLNLSLHQKLENGMLHPQVVPVLFYTDRTIHSPTHANALKSQKVYDHL